MPTQQTDALELSCGNTAEPDPHPEAAPAGFPTQAAAAQVPNTPHAPRAEFIDLHGDSGVSAGPVEASFASLEQNETEAEDNDLASLFACFRTYSEKEQYHEFVQEEDARHAGCRWPLLVESRAACPGNNEDGSSC